MDHHKSKSTNKHEKDETPAPTSTIYIALFNYRANSKTDISFEKGDLMEVLSQNESNRFGFRGNILDNDWLKVRHLKSKQRGMVPTSFVAVKDSLRAQDWFLESTSRIQAAELVMMEKNCIGTFILQPSAHNPNCFSLTVKDYSVEDGVHLSNIPINIDYRGSYYISPSVLRYKTVIDLITDYQKKRGLIQPCPKPVPQLWGSYEIPHNEILLIKQIGAGKLSEVFLGKWRETVDVAVKTLKQGAISAEALMYEMKIMIKFRHNKLLSLYAVCTLEEPIYIVTEYMTNGSLKNYLQKSGPEIVKFCHLIYIVTQVASGMAYLESRNCVHRNLTARNILIGDDYCAKVAGFEFAGELLDDLKVDTLLPVKWTAPEALRFSKFSTKSDVWSFGIVMMETFTYGVEPYPEMNETEVVNTLKIGYRMPKPDNVPEQVYDKMIKCWKERPEERPTFEHLKFALEYSDYEDV